MFEALVLSLFIGCIMSALYALAARESVLKAVAGWPVVILLLVPGMAIVVAAFWALNVILR